MSLSSIPCSTLECHSGVGKDDDDGDDDDFSNIRETASTKALNREVMVIAISYFYGN